MPRWRRVPPLTVWLMVIASGASAASEPPEIPAGYRPHIWTLKHGEVDWTVGAIVAEGKAVCRTDRELDRSVAERGAAVEASRSASELVKGVQIDRTGRFDDFKDSLVDVEIFLGKYTDVRLDWTGKLPKTECRAEMIIPFWGASGLAGVIHEKYRARAMSAGRMPMTHPRFDEPEPGDMIIIDARGIDLLPCMFPIVVTSDGRVLYDATVREQVHGEVRPAVQYLEATPTPPTTTAPATQPASRPANSGAMHLKATGAGGLLRTDIVIRRDDAASLSQDARAIRLLKEGRVYVVVDPFKPATTAPVTTQQAAPMIPKDRPKLHQP